MLKQYEMSESCCNSYLESDDKFKNNFRSGLDVTKIDLLPYKVGTDGGYKTAVFEFKCEFRTKFMYNGQVSNSEYNSQLSHQEPRS